MGSVVSLFRTSPAEKARKRAKRENQARQAESDKRAKNAKAEGEGKAAAAKLALLSTSAQGVLSEAQTGKKKLLGNG